MIIYCCSPGPGFSLEYMWQGHDLRLARTQIAGSLATAKGLKLAFQTFQRGVETPAVNNHIHQSDRGSNQPICHCAVRAPD